MDTKRAFPSVWATLGVSIAACTLFTGGAAAKDPKFTDLRPVRIQRPVTSSRSVKRPRLTQVYLETHTVREATALGIGVPEHWRCSEKAADGGLDSVIRSPWPT
jgi:hypothetical protein